LSVDPTVDPLTPNAILERFQRCRRVGEPIAARYRRIATVNENFVQGNQWVAGVHQGTSAFRDSWFDDEGVPRIYVNECQGLMTTWSALLNKDRRSAVADPVTEELDDIYDAEITNKVIEFFIYEQNTASKIHETVQYAFQDGTAGLKITIDRKTRSIVWAPLTIHTYWIDPVADYRRAQWVIFENHYGEDEVDELWEKNGLKEKSKPPVEQEYTNAAGETLYGVVGYEIWQKPTRQFPDGFYACVINDEVVERMPYPYVVQTDGDPEYLLPLCLMKTRTVRDSAYGITPMTDIVPLQRSLNEAVSRIQMMLRQLTKVYLLLPKSLQADLDAKPSTASIGFDESAKGINAARAIGFTKAGDVPQGLHEQRDYFRAMMNEVAGLNDVTVGNEQRSLSGKALENIYELDKQKNADAAKSLEDMVIDAFGLTIALFQLFYPVLRQALIGNASAAEIARYDFADVRGAKLRLQQASELDKLASVREGAAQEGVLAGTKTLGDLEKARRSPAWGMSRQLAEETVAQFLAGQDVEVSPDDLDLNVFLDVIGRKMSEAMSEGRREDWKALYRLRRWVSSEMAPAQDAAQPKQDATPSTSAAPSTPATGLTA